MPFETQASRFLSPEGLEITTKGLESVGKAVEVKRGNEVVWAQSFSEITDITSASNPHHATLTGLKWKYDSYANCMVQSQFLRITI